MSTRQKNVQKAVKVTLLSLAVVVLVLVVLFSLFGERAVKAGVEAAASGALEVPVTIEDVDLSIFGGSVGIEGLAVENPPGYEFDNLLQLKNAFVKTDIGSLLSDTVRIEEIKLDTINLVIEQKGLSNNLKDVLNVISAKAPETAEPEPSKPKPAKEGKKLEIDKLEITNTKVQVKLLPIAGKADTINLNLPTIRMSNIGAEKKVNTAELTEKILLAIADGVANAGAGVLPEDVVSGIRSAVDKTAELGKEAAEEGQKLLETGQKAGEEIIEGFKGLLDRKKDD